MQKFDAYTKTVLTIIAAALVVIALKIGAPAARANDGTMSVESSTIIDDLSKIDSALISIQNDEDNVASGRCLNSKICGL